jgi:Putative zinc- or iron-chelating domain
VSDPDRPLAERFGADVDKYLIGAGTPVPCAELIPICKARCCKLPHYLSKQDLAEGVIQWELDEPYRIAHGADAFCVHSNPETRGCGVYQQRPAICRTYDCRDDWRIWDDFERRIPAPWDRMPDLVQLRVLKKSVRLATEVEAERTGNRKPETGNRK